MPSQNIIDWITREDVEALAADVGIPDVVAQCGEAVVAACCLAKQVRSQSESVKPDSKRDRILKRARILIEKVDQIAKVDANPVYVRPTQQLVKQLR